MGIYEIVNTPFESGGGWGLFVFHKYYLSPFTRTRTFFCTPIREASLVIVCVSTEYGNENKQITTTKHDTEVRKKERKKERRKEERTVSIWKEERRRTVSICNNFKVGINDAHVRTFKEPDSRCKLSI